MDARAEMNAGARTIYRKVFVHRGRRYVVVRFCFGRPELYRVEADGWTETFMRYAQKHAGTNLDRKAIDLIEDVLDEAARMARNILSGAYVGHTKDVRVRSATGNMWGSVQCEFVPPGSTRRRLMSCSVRLYSPIGGA